MGLMSLTASANGEGGMIITRETPFLIYGAGGLGIHALRLITEAERRVAGFIDRRAAEIGRFCQLPVYTPEEAARLPLAGAVVVITVKNVFIHGEIAQSLQALGFRHLIFKPLAILKGGGQEAERQVNALHDTLIAQYRWFGENVHLPEAPPPSAPDFEDHLRIEENREEVTAWIPAELIFSNVKPHGSFSECNMPLYFPYVGLYQGLLADSAAPEDWRDDFIVFSSGWLARNDLPLTRGQGDSLLASRVAIFQEMERRFEIDLPFFARNAPRAAMLEPGRFTLTSSGKNRVAFLLAKGFRFIPLKVPRPDYEDWNAPGRLAPLREYLKISAGPLLAPVPHPFFADMPAEFVDYARLFTVKIAYALIRSYYRKHIVTRNGLRLFADAPVAEAIRTTGVNCLLRDGGAAARYFASLGFPTRRFFDPAWLGEAELARNIDNLFAPAAPPEAGGDILLLDSAAAADLAEGLIKTAAAVYFLQRNDEEVPPAVTGNFQETGRLFATMGRAGRMAGRAFTRRA